MHHGQLPSQVWDANLRNGLNMQGVLSFRRALYHRVRTRRCGVPVPLAHRCACGWVALRPDRSYDEHICSLWVLDVWSLLPRFC